MLRPADLAAADLAVALKPSVGYEKQLYLSASPHYELGTLLLEAVNSGTYTKNISDNSALADAPSELVAVVATEIADAGANIVLTVTGTDSDGNALTGTATIQPPTYAPIQDKIFPVGYAVEVIPATSGKKFKTVTSVTPTNNVKAKGTKITIFALPAVSTFYKVGCKVSLSYDEKVPLPVSIQCGRDRGAFTKLGEIGEGKLSITAKMPNNSSDGLSRFRGVRCTGLIKETKEEKLDTQHIFFMGLILTPTVNNGESVEPDTYSAEGTFEDYAQILAQQA